MSLAPFTPTLLVALALPLVGGLLPATARDWRWTLLGVALAEAGVGWLVLQIWPLPMALSLLVAGWLAASFLGLGQGQQWRAGASPPAAWGGRLFRFTLVGFALVLLALHTPRLAPWLPESLGLYQTWASVGLMVASLLHLAMTQHPFRVTASLMGLLAGFSLLYAHVEHSLLLTVLLVGVKLFLGAMGGYLLFAPLPEGEG